MPSSGQSPWSSSTSDSDEMKKIENYFHMYTISRVNDFAKPLRQSQIPYNILIVMDSQIKERLCVEIIVGSRGSVGDLKILIDRAYDQILEEELMHNTDEELLMSLLVNERRQQSHTSTRRKRAKRRQT